MTIPYYVPPEQMMKDRAEFARKGIARGRSIVAAEYDDGIVRVRLTYTATACPCMEFIREDITDRLEQESWIRSVELEEVWDPPWTTELISPEGREKLRSLGVGA